MANRKGLDSLDSLFGKAMSVSLVLGGKESCPVVGASSLAGMQQAEGPVQEARNGGYTPDRRRTLITSRVHHIAST